MAYRHPLSLSLAAAVAAAIHPAFAQDEAEDSRFNLGEIVVIGSRPDSLSSVGGSVVTGEQSWQFQKLSLEQALSLAPGVNTTPRGRRNESDIFVRGFGRWQVPLMIDGVRIYLPADNRLDFGRFLTADIAAIQIQKGYASVLDGPGAMGGAINLVTVKPTKAFELCRGRYLRRAAAATSRASNGYLMAGTRFNNSFTCKAAPRMLDRDLVERVG